MLITLLLIDTVHLVDCYSLNISAQNILSCWAAHYRIGHIFGEMICIEFLLSQGFLITFERQAVNQISS